MVRECARFHGAMEWRTRGGSFDQCWLMLQRMKERGGEWACVWVGVHGSFPFEMSCCGQRFKNGRRAATGEHARCRNLTLTGWEVPTIPEAVTKGRWEPGSPGAAACPWFLQPRPGVVSLRLTPRTPFPSPLVTSCRYVCHPRFSPSCQHGPITWQHDQASVRPRTPGGTAHPVLMGSLPRIDARILHSCCGQGQVCVSAIRHHA